jgi:hypothetical protein
MEGVHVEILAHGTQAGSFSLPSSARFPFSFLVFADRRDIRLHYV